MTALNLHRVIAQAIADIARQFGLSHVEAINAVDDFIADDRAARLDAALARECEREEA